MVETPQAVTDFAEGVIAPPELKRFIFRSPDGSEIAAPHLHEPLPAPPPVAEIVTEAPKAEAKTETKTETPPEAVEAVAPSPFVFPEGAEQPPVASLFQFTGPDIMPTEQEAEPLSSRGMAYFRQMLAQFQTFPHYDPDPAACLHDNPEAVSAIHDLIARAEGSGVLTWDDLERMEIALLRVLPATQLRSQAWNMRAHYFETAGPTQAALYLASKPADWDDAILPEEDLRADMEVLVSEMQKDRLLPAVAARVHEDHSKEATQWILRLCGGGVAGYLVMRFLPIPTEAAPLLPLVAALLGGAVGGFFGLQNQLTRIMQPRLSQRDRLLSVIAPTNPYLFPIRGAVIAGIFYFLLLGGFLKGALLPQADPAALMTPEGGARLLVWCFLLGLAVRFVPDIPKLLTPRKVRQKSAEDAPLAEKSHRPLGLV